MVPDAPQLSTEAKRHADRMAGIVLLCMLAWLVPFLVDILIDYAGRIFGRPDLGRERSVLLATPTLGLLIVLLAILRLYQFYRTHGQAFLSAVGAGVAALAAGGYVYLGLQLAAVHLIVLAGAGTGAAVLLFLQAASHWLFTPPE